MAGIIYYKIYTINNNWGFAPVAGIIYYKIYTINNNWGFAPVAGIIHYKIYTSNITIWKKWLGYNPRLGTN